MGKISDYTRVLAAKLADVFVVDQTDNGTTETKSATVEQIGTAIGTLQTFADLDTSNKNLVDAINEIASYTPVYGNTASGSIATFDTSLALPLQDCTIEINGTGATGANITRCGKNLFDKSTITSGAILTRGQNTTTPNASYAVSDYIPVKAGERYTISSGDFNIWYSTYYDKDKNVSSETPPSSAPFVIPEGVCYFRITVNIANINQAQLVFGSTVGTYEAYNGNTYPITWQDEAGTVSEGSLNVTTGKLTVVTGSMGAGDYQITPIPINQISGTNNIFCDTGNTSVVYACSLKDYIDSQ